MEYIDRIFYRKVNPSDFKKLYDIDKPETGGGQTYLEAAGIAPEDMIRLIGHTNYKTTTENYIHQNLEKLRSAINKIK